MPVRVFRFVYTCVGFHVTNIVSPCMKLYFRAQFRLALCIVCIWCFRALIFTRPYARYYTGYFPCAQKQIKYHPDTRMFSLKRHL